MRRISTRKVMFGMLSLQLVFAAVLMGRDLITAWPGLIWPSSQPAFDMPVTPGDQTRRYRPGNMPLAPPGDGNPDRPFRSTADMPDRLNFARDGATLTLTGSIEPGDFDRLLEQLDDALTTVRLNSPGGSVRDALDIGKALRDRALNTVLEEGDICLSACPYILAAGVARRVHPDAQVGVHQHYFGANSALPAFLAVEVIQSGQAEVMTHLFDMGVDPMLMQHGLATPWNEIYVLLPEQLETYRLATDIAP